MVLKDGLPAMSIGTPGTVGQTCTLAQILVRLLARGEAPERAVAAPRWSVTLDGKPAVERAMAEPLRRQVAAALPELAVMPTGWLSFGSVKIAIRTDGPEGPDFTGIADGRRVAGPAAF